MCCEFVDDYGTFIEQLEMVGIHVSCHVEEATCNKACFSLASLKRPFSCHTPKFEYFCRVCLFYSRERTLTKRLVAKPKPPP